jgi:DNA-binding NtrC family response regulator
MEMGKISTIHKGVGAPMNLRVLVLDDSEFDRTRLHRLISKLEPNTEVVSCSNIEEFQKELDNGSIDICLIDHHLGEASGLDALEIAKLQKGIDHLPMIMISGQENTETIVESMQAGCASFLGKDGLTVEKLRDVIYKSLSDNFSSEEFGDEVLRATNNVIGAFSKGCVSELQPRLRRVFKQAEFIRSCHAHKLLPSPEALDEIEKHCLMIWRFFAEVENYSEGLDKTKH